MCLIVVAHRCNLTTLPWRVGKTATKRLRLDLRHGLCVEEHARTSTTVSTTNVVQTSANASLQLLCRNVNLTALLGLARKQRPLKLLYRPQDLLDWALNVWLFCHTDNFGVMHKFIDVLRLYISSSAERVIVQFSPCRRYNARGLGELLSKIFGHHYCNNEVEGFRTCCAARCPLGLFGCGRGHGGHTT